MANEVAHWKMNDNANNNVVVNDFGTNGALRGADTEDINITGKIGGALGLNGSDEYIDCNQTFQTTFRSSFSISLWIKPDDGQPGSTEKIFGSGNVTIQDLIHMDNETNGTIEFWYESDGDIGNVTTATAVLSDGAETWHHVVGVANDTTNLVYIYFDGVLSNTSSCAGVTFADFTTTVEFYFGARNSPAGAQSHFDGGIDDFRIFDKALSAGEVRAIYNGGDGTEGLLNHTYVGFGISCGATIGIC